jgi:molybdate transport system permease protein
MRSPHGIDSTSAGGHAAPLVLAAAAIGFLAVPLAALFVRAPWRRLGAVALSPVVLDAVRLSLVVASLSTAFALALGLPLAWVLARRAGGVIAVLRALTLLPLVLPPVVAGIALLAAFGRRGLVGRLADDLGYGLPFTTAGAIVAATFVSLPLATLVLESGVRKLDPRLDEAAIAMGASGWRRWRQVTIPLLRPHLAAAAGLSFARGLGEFGATITFAGNLRGTTQTLSLAAYEALQTDPGAAIGMSLLMLGLSATALWLARGRWTID